MKRLLFSLLIILLTLSSCTKKEEKLPLLVLRYADNQPEHFPTTKAARYFAALVKDRTNGMIEIDVFSNGQLGKETETFNQILFGGIDFSRFSLAVLESFNPRLSLLQLPYLYRDGEHMWAVLDGEIGNNILESTEDKGAQGLCWFDAGARSFYTQKKVTKLEDIEGEKIRVQESEQMSALVQSLGAESVQLAYGDVYSALQCYLIDGAENNLPSYMSTGHYQAAPYFFLDEHNRIPEIMMMSDAAKEKIASVDPSFNAIIKACALDASRYERELWQKEETSALALAEKEGVTITIPSEKEKERWAERMKNIYKGLKEEDQFIVDEIRKVR